MPPFFVSESYSEFLRRFDHQNQTILCPEERNRPAQFVPAVTGHKFNPEGYSETGFAGIGYSASLYDVSRLFGSSFEIFLLG